MQNLKESKPSASLTLAQRTAILAQLESVLGSTLFNQSKRYPAFLRYVVDSTVQGAEDELKERTIGVEVFGRLPHYDTSLDPVVRLTAAEVRKRLAQYYQREEHALELQILLHPGSYVPEFSWPTGSAGDEAALAPAEAEAVLVPEPVHVEQPVALERPGGNRRSVAVAVAVAVLVLLAVGFAAYRHLSSTARARDLWSPLLADKRPVSLVLPDLSKADILLPERETDSTSAISHVRYNRLVDFNDSEALARMAELLAGHGKEFNVRLSSETTFEDLQKGPTVLIGALDNPWTMRCLETLPYSAVRQGNSMVFEIVGRDRAERTDWSIDLAQPYGAIKQDFGIIVREQDSMTGRPVLIVAGLGQNGTAAGIRLLTDPALASGLLEGAPKDWSGRNLEVVYRTQIINDKFGPPVIVRREYW